VSSDEIQNEIRRLMIVINDHEQKMAAAQTEIEAAPVQAMGGRIR
jgi:hypothetical protein